MQHKCDRFTAWSSSTCQLPRHYLCCEDIISIFRELLVIETWHEISLIPNYFLNGNFSVCYNITLWLMLTKDSFLCLIWLSSLQSQLNIHNWVTHWWRFSGSIQPWKTLLKAKSPRSQIRSIILMLAPTGNITTRWLKDNTAICITGQIYREYQVISWALMFRSCDNLPVSPWALKTCTIWVYLI